MNEASYLLNSSGTEDFTRYSEGEAMSERVREWLATPEGTVAHNPSWGHNLLPFKHDPLSKDLSFLITLAISRKLPLDVEDIVLRSLEVVFLDVDMFKLTIWHQFGTETIEIQL